MLLDGVLHNLEMEDLEELAVEVGAQINQQVQRVQEELEEILVQMVVHQIQEELQEVQEAVTLEVVAVEEHTDVVLVVLAVQE